MATKGKKILAGGAIISILAIGIFILMEYSKRRSSATQEVPQSPSAPVTSAQRDTSVLQEREGLEKRKDSQEIDSKGVSLPAAQAPSQTEAPVSPPAVSAPATSPPVAIPSVSPSSAPAKKEAALAPLSEGCFSVSYSHKKLPSHADGEACLKHKNLFTLQGPQPINFLRMAQKSICVRVNGDPVKFESVSGKKDQIMIGAVAGPNAKVSISYCLGKTKCNHPCVIKKDEFMSALGMDGSDGELKTGWDGSKGNSKEDAELESEVAAFSKERDGFGSGAEKESVFSGWIVDESDFSCPSKGG